MAHRPFWRPVRSSSHSRTGETRMMRSRIQLAAAVAVFLAGSAAMAQYSRSAGQNAPAATVRQEYVDGDGQRQYRDVEVKAAADKFGNAAGNQHDLAVDGAFDGQT